jgi:hypothetical protein
MSDDASYNDDFSFNLLRTEQAFTESAGKTLKAEAAANKSISKAIDLTLRAPRSAQESKSAQSAAIKYQAGLTDLARGGYRNTIGVIDRTSLPKNVPTKTAVAIKKAIIDHVLASEIKIREMKWNDRVSVANYPMTKSFSDDEDEDEDEDEDKAVDEDDHEDHEEEDEVEEDEDVAAPRAVVKVRLLKLLNDIDKFLGPGKLWKESEKKKAVKLIDNIIFENDVVELVKVALIKPIERVLN